VCIGCAGPCVCVKGHMQTAVCGCAGVCVCECAGLCVCRPLCLCVCVCAGLCVCVCVCSPVAFTLDRVGSDPDWTDGSTSIILI